MPRPPSGTLEVHRWKDGRTISFRARVRANGERHRLDFGTNLEGWSEERARNELERIIDRIRRGTWEPPEAPTASSPRPGEETVQVTLSRWWSKKQSELADSTRSDYRWRIDHILSELGREPTAALTPLRIDEFRQALSAGGLAPRSVNMVLDVLAQALDDAVDYDLLASNPARGKRRRMRVPKPQRAVLEPDMVIDLLDVAGEWEAALPLHQRYGRRALLALMLLSGGPRISEVTLADRGDLDLESGRWRIPKSKTDAGARDVELTAYTTRELQRHLAARAPGAHEPLFPTRNGGRLNASNIRNRLLAECVARVNVKRAENGRMLLPRVTPHTLRRTWASLTLLAGRDVRWVMAQMGHEDARLTLQVYAQVVQRKSADHRLVWKLMRFEDEPARPPS
jgi:integrase